MPYVNKEKRRYLDDGGAPTTPGDLNYEFTQLMLDYVKKEGRSYATINAVIGALECAKAEFYRRLVVPYESSKIVENGDVYPTT